MANKDTFDEGIDAATEGNDKSESNSNEVKKPKRGKRKLLIALCAVVGIVAIASIGLMAWHEQPSFCATMCHPVMGSYVESWEEGTALAHSHAQMDISCLDCHEATIEDQLHELQVYVAGTYRTPLVSRDYGDEFCERCHTRDSISAMEIDVDYNSVPDRLIKMLEEEGYEIDQHPTVSPHTQGIGTNPDNPHVGDAQLPECSTCHSAHKGSGTTLQSCYSCHHSQTFAPCATCHTTLQG